MKKPILVVLAAGVGSRFGGLKQMTPFGLHGEGIIDYSLYDALQAGFERVAFIVNSKIKDDFHNFIGKNIEKHMEVSYVLQELDMLPEGFHPPKDRQKPWGTGHAVLCAKDAIDAPFCVINGDDLYGRSAYEQMYAYLSKEPKEGEYAMVGFELGKTLSDYGYVSRGVCDVSENGYLNSVVERLHIISSVDGPLYTEDGKNYVLLPADTTVSMNMWGFTQNYIDHLAEGFGAFYKEAMATNPTKAEYLLPNIVGDLLKQDKASVKVLHSSDKWYGVTNASDRPLVEAAIKNMTQDGIYPDGLWK
ncbi:MAG: sugar phosphate nucleotidyltransferase [Eubacteriales bacterium]|nr:sugar phosphate nucleotidyltransferase [Eubacteriales bacterium]